MSSGRQRGAMGPLPIGPGHGRPGTEDERKVKDRGFVIKRLWGYLRSFSVRIVLITLLVAVVTVLQLGGPYIGLPEKRRL